MPTVRLVAAELIVAVTVVLATEEIDRVLVIPTFKHPFAKPLAPYDDLVATALWLSGSGASFVTGVTVSVDGGFSAFSGV